MLPPQPWFERPWWSKPWLISVYHRSDFWFEQRYDTRPLVSEVLRDVCRLVNPDQDGISTVELAGLYTSAGQNILERVEAIADYVPWPARRLQDEPYADLRLWAQMTPSSISWPQTGVMRVCHGCGFERCVEAQTREQNQVEVTRLCRTCLPDDDMHTGLAVWVDRDDYLEALLLQRRRAFQARRDDASGRPFFWLP